MDGTLTSPNPGWRRKIEQGTEEECVLACDHLAELSPEEPREPPVRALLVALKRSEIPVQTAALRGLLRLWYPGGSGLREVLACALTAEDLVVREAALDVLERMLREGDLASRELARSMFSAATTSAFPLCAHLGSLLLERGGALLESELALLEALRWKLDEDQHASVRQAAAEALAALGPRCSGVSLWLLEAAAAAEVEVALASLRALLLIAPDAPETDAALARLLARREREAIQGALELALDQIRGDGSSSVVRVLLPPVLRPLLGQLWSRTIQALAVALLGELGDNPDLDLLLPLVSTFTDARRSALWGALEALARRGILSRSHAETFSRSARREERALGVLLLGAVAPADPEARSSLLRVALSSPEEHLRATVALLLRSLPAGEVGGALSTAVIAAQTHGQRKRAVELLVRCGPSLEHLPLLLEALRDPTSQVRVWACRGVGVLGQTLPPEERDRVLAPAYPLLLRRLADPSSKEVVRSVLVALEPVPPPGFPLGRLLVRYPDWRGIFCELFPEQFSAEPGISLFRAWQKWSRKESGPDVSLSTQDIAWFLSAYWERSHKS